MNSFEITPYANPIDERMSENLRLPQLSIQTFARATVRNLVVNDQRYGAVDYLPQGLEYNDLARQTIISEDDERYRAQYVAPLKDVITPVTRLIDADNGLTDVTPARRLVMLQHISQEKLEDIDKNVKLDMLLLDILRNKQIPRVAKAADDIKCSLELRQRKLHTGVVQFGNEILEAETSPYYALLCDANRDSQLRIGKLLGFKLVKAEEGINHRPVLKNRTGKVGHPSDQTEVLGLLKRQPPLRLV